MTTYKAYQPKKTLKKERPPLRERGGYNLLKWRRIRLWFLRRHPMCERCEDNGRMTPATEVHHKQRKAGGGSGRPDNLAALCKSCHSKITVRGG